jgi:rare lipoprotein A
MRRCTAAALVLAGAAIPSKAEEHGVASHYDTPQKVACGGRLNVRALTAAHKTLPCGTRVTVTNKRNGRSVVVRINDRGPYIRGRIIDLTPAGAQALGFKGLASVAIRREL